MDCAHAVLSGTMYLLLFDLLFCLQVILCLIFIKQQQGTLAESTKENSFADIIFNNRMTPLVM